LRSLTTTTARLSGGIAKGSYNFGIGYYFDKEKKLADLKTMPTFAA
jgi:hypothetical protein